MAWQDGMKVDPVAIASLGCYSESYGAAEQKNLCNLYASWGYIEDAVNTAINIAAIVWAYHRQREGQ